MKFVFFDLDGTLTDPGIGITNSVMYALKKFGIEEKDRKELFRFIGPPLIPSFMKYYGFSKEEAVRAVVFYREYYAERGIFENKLYAGIPELLGKLKDDGIKVVMATSKPEIFAEKIAKHYDIAKYFDLIAGATESETRTEKDEVIAELDVSADDQLDELIRSKYAARLENADEKALKKVIDSLARKGFSYSDIRAAIGRFCDAELYD